MQKDYATRLASEILRELVLPGGRPTTPPPLAYKLLRTLAARARRLGIALEEYVVGPWHVGEGDRNLWSRMGALCPTVERGRFALLARDPGEAAEISGLLNWCEVPEPGVG